jgi:hypothetical protein
MAGPIKFAHFVPIHYQTWPPQTILVSDWLISKKSSPLKLLGQMNRNLVGSILGKSFIKIANLAPIRSSFDSFGQAVSEETMF